MSYCIMSSPESSENTKEQIKNVDATAEDAANSEQYAETATSAAVGLTIALGAIKDIASIVPGVGIAFAAASQLAIIYAKNAKLYALLMDIKEILAQNFLMSRMIESSMKIIGEEIQAFNNADQNNKIEEIKIPSYVVERITTKINKLNEYLTRYIPASITEGRDMSKFKFKMSESFSKFKSDVSSNLKNMFTRKSQQYGGGLVSNSITKINNFMSAGTIFENIHNHLNVMNAFFIIMNQRFETIRAHYANHTNDKLKTHFNTVIWPKILQSNEYMNYIKDQTTEDIFKSLIEFNESNSKVQEGANLAANTMVANAKLHTAQLPTAQFGGRTNRRRRTKNTRRVNMHYKFKPV